MSWVPLVVLQWPLSKKQPTRRNAVGKNQNGPSKPLFCILLYGIHKIITEYLAYPFYHLYLSIKRETCPDMHSDYRWRKLFFPYRRLLNCKFELKRMVSLITASHVSLIQRKRKRAREGIESEKLYRNSSSWRMSAILLQDWTKSCQRITRPVLLVLHLEEKK